MIPEGEAKVGEWGDDDRRQRIGWTMWRAILSTLVGMAPYFIFGGGLLVSYLSDIRKDVNEMRMQSALQAQAIQFLQTQRTETNAQAERDRSETKRQIENVNGQLQAISSTLGVRAANSGLQR